MVIGRLIRKRAAQKTVLQPLGEQPDEQLLMSRIVDSMEGGV